MVILSHSILNHFIVILVLEKLIITTMVKMVTIVVYNLIYTAIEHPSEVITSWWTVQLALRTYSNFPGEKKKWMIRDKKYKTRGESQTEDSNIA